MSNDEVVQIMRLNGILGASQAKSLNYEVSEAINSGATHILVNMEDVVYMDSSGLGGLIMALKTARQSCAKLSLCAVRQEVRMLLDIANVEQLFDTLPNLNTLPAMQ